MNLVSVPASAFQPNKTVWVFDDGMLRIQDVKVAYSDGKKVVLVTDPTRLAKGDLVVTSPLPVAEEGMLIRLTDESRDEESAESNQTMTASESKEPAAI